MRIEVLQTEEARVVPLRELYRHESNCQLIRDSLLSRGFGRAYLILVDGRTGGYGAVWTKHYENRLGEFYVMPHLRRHALPMVRELVAVSGATQMEAQTNLPLSLAMLYDCAENIQTENFLFQDRMFSCLSCPGTTFRPAGPEDKTDSQWVLEKRGALVASGGVLTHYNPPFGDLYMEVVEDARGQGYGSYIVQELKRVAYESGRLPAARCNPDNEASRRTLEKAGMLMVGRILAGDIRAR
ncbi:MAG TPA: GNAT family N-acetyltransferase [Fimbriimonas sp.]|nr:GNAT family N-acetyltransferase [Fimbriimonas sp.]